MKRLVQISDDFTNPVYTIPCTLGSFSKFAHDIDYFIVIWYNMYIDFSRYKLLSGGGEMYGSNEKSEPKNIRAVQNLSSE